MALKVGDEVYLTSDDLGLKRTVVKSIRLDDKDVKVIKKGDDVGVDFGIKVKSGTEVYVIKKII